MGVVANDQGHDLVDTTVLRACGITAREVGGGCFCCCFDRLVDATEGWPRDLAPEVLVAEAVGSCTDLVATVVRPLQALHADHLTVGPVSVFVDVRRLAPGRAPVFSADVEYIAGTQLEDADLIVLSKCDLLPPEEVAARRAAVAQACPQATVMALSSTTGAHVAEWARAVLYGTPRRSPAAVDYARYGAGEARLAWLDLVATLATPAAVDPIALLESVVSELQRALHAAGIPIAHLKAALSTEGGVISVNVVSGDERPVLGLDRASPSTRATLQLNLRAESDPSTLDALARTVLDAGAARWRATFEVGQVRAFSPSPPVPTHRMP